GSLGGNDLQRLHDSWHYFVLNAGVEAFGVLAHDNQIDIGIARRHVGQIPDGPEIRIELELFTQRDVDAGKAAADWRGDGPLQRDLVSFDRLREIFWNVFAVLRISVSTGGIGLPLEFHARRFEDANRRIDHFRSNAVARDQGY